MDRRAIAPLPSCVRFIRARQSLKGIEPGNAAIDALGVEGLCPREQREAHASEDTELDDVARDCLVVHVLERAAERRPTRVAHRHLRDDVACLVAGGAPGAANGAVDERHDIIPAGASTRGATDHAQSTCT